MEIRKESLGPKHILTIEAISHLAPMLRKQGRHEEVEAAHIQVLEARRVVMGPKDPETISAMVELACTWFKQGHYEERKLLSETLELRKSLRGLNYPDTLIALHNIAVTRHALGRHEEAVSRKRHEQCCGTEEQVLGRSHPYTVHSMELLAEWQEDRRKREAQTEEDDTLELLNLYTDDPPQPPSDQAPTHG